MTTKPTTLKGRVWLITDAENRLVDDIDTDMIFHNAHLAITDINKMGPLAFGNLQGWEDFPKKAGKGDIMIVGKNFGAGSSRQQAVDCFISLGIQAILAESFGAIYKRNAINTGLPILSKEALTGGAGNPLFGNGDIVEIDLENSRVKNLTREKTISMDPFSKVQMDIYQAGGLFAFGKTLAMG